MTKVAVFPGSFDPITIGHVDLVERSLQVFDRVIVAIGNNSSKKYHFPLEQRIRFIQEIFKQKDAVSVDTFDALTVDFCKNIDAKFILRGLRTTGDYDFEKTIAQLNKSLAPDIETICLISRPELSHISSTIVREIISHGGDIKKFVHKAVYDLMQEET